VQNLAIIETVLNILADQSNITAGVKGVVSTNLGVVNIDYVKTI
jgi:hypothetical protein